MKSNILASNCIELGQFRSVRSRAGIKWSKTIGKETNESRLESTTTPTQLQTTESQRKAEQVAKDIIAAVKTSIEIAIDRANILMPAEFPHERYASVLLSSLLFKY